VQETNVYAGMAVAVPFMYQVGLRRADSQ